MRMIVRGFGEPVALQHVAFQCLKHQVLLLLKLLVAKFEDGEVSASVRGLRELSRWS
jgi:hypothetical protein